MGRSMRLCIIVGIALGLLVPQAHAADQGPSDRGERLLLKLINEFRVKEGLPEVVQHNFMSKEARKHNNYMANQGQLSHDRFGERTGRIADNDSGIDEDKICENVASAQGYDAPGPVAKLIYRAWKRTAGKRACLLDNPFTKQSAGVGVTLVGDTWYATYLGAHDTSP